MDGEGSFLIALNKNKSRPSFNCYIQVKLREDDVQVLEEIYHTLRCGHLYYYNYAKARRAGERSSDQIAWICYRSSDLVHVVIPVLDQFGLRSKKCRDYEIWREAVLSKYEGKHTARKMLRLKRELEYTRRNHRLALSGSRDF